MSWAISHQPVGWIVTWNSIPMSSPHKTELLADAHMTRMKARYTDKTASILSQMAKKRRRGIYHFEWPGGSRSIRESGLAPAKRALRSVLGRRRLPNGLTWEFEPY